MTVAILLHGKLERAPETRVSRNGSTFTMATIRVSAGGEMQFWRVFVFSESAQAELSRLGEGDALSVQGIPKFELYRPAGGEPHVSLSMTVDNIVALKQPREKKPKAAAPPKAESDRSRLDRHAGDGEPDPSLDDAMPF